MDCRGSSLRKIVLTSLLLLTGCPGSSTTSSSATAAPGVYTPGGSAGRYNSGGSGPYSQRPNRSGYAQPISRGYDSGSSYRSGAPSYGGDSAYGEDSSYPKYDSQPLQRQPISSPLIDSYGSDSHYNPGISDTIGSSLTEDQRERIVEQSLKVNIPVQSENGWTTSKIRLSEISKLDMHQRMLVLLQTVKNLEAQIQQRQGPGAQSQNQQMQMQLQNMQRQMAQLQQQGQIAQSQLSRVTEIIQAAPGEDPIVKLQTIMSLSKKDGTSEDGSASNGSETLYNKLLTELGVTDQSEAYQKITELQKSAEAATNAGIVKRELEDKIGSVEEALGATEDDDLTVMIQENNKEKSEALKRRDALQTKLDALKELLPEGLQEGEIAEGIKTLAKAYEGNPKSVKDEVSQDEDDADADASQDEGKEEGDAVADDKTAPSEDTTILNKILSIFKKQPKEKIYAIVKRLYDRYLSMQKALVKITVPGIKTTPEKLQHVAAFYKEVKTALGIESDEGATSSALSAINKLKENEVKPAETVETKQGDTKTEESGKPAIVVDKSAETVEIGQVKKTEETKQGDTKAEEKRFIPDREKTAEPKPSVGTPTSKATPIQTPPVKVVRPALKPIGRKPLKPVVKESTETVSDEEKRQEESRKKLTAMLKSRQAKIKAAAAERKATKPLKPKVKESTETVSGEEKEKRQAEALKKLMEMLKSRQAKSKAAAAERLAAKKAKPKTDDSASKPEKSVETAAKPSSKEDDAMARFKALIAKGKFTVAPQEAAGA